MKSTLLMLAGLLPMVAVGSPPARSIVEHPEVASAIRAFEVWMEFKMETENWPGVSVGIVHDQELVYARGFGFANVEEEIPADADTLYAIASNTKSFTAIATLILRDEGKLELDDPVSSHVDEFKGLDERCREKFPGAPPISILNLLTHTSGLPRDPKGTDFANNEQYPPLEEINAGLTGITCVYAPGTKWKYSNLAVTQESRVITEVSGMPYKDFIRTRILEPLQMASTDFDPREEQRGRVATGYGPLRKGKRGVFPLREIRGFAAAGGLWSSVSDLARFASWQFRLLDHGDEEILNPYTLAEMQTVHRVDESWKFGFGLGFLIYNENGTLVGHGGGLPGYSTDLTIDPSNRIGVIVLANGDVPVYPDRAEPESVSHRLFAQVVPAIEGASKPEEEQPARDPSWSLYVGKYQNPTDRRVVMIHENRLVLVDPAKSDPTSGFTLIPREERHTFGIEGGNAFSVIGEEVVFELNEHNQVMRMVLPDNSYERVQQW